MKVSMLNRIAIFLACLFILFLSVDHCAFAASSVPGEVLVNFKEGVDPEAVLREADIIADSIERVHSPQPAIAKFKKGLKLKKDADGWFWFRGKTYQAVGRIPDKEIFESAYAAMNPAEKSLYRVHKVSLPEETDIETAIQELQAHPAVEYAEPNYLYETQMIPNDPYYHSYGTWGQAYDDLWGLKEIGCEAAWDTGQGQETVVAVIDTGVDYNHEDLAQNIWLNEAEINGEEGVDDDGNGYVDDIRGWNFNTVIGFDRITGDPITKPEDNDVTDKHGHGTHCSGTVAAVGNNGLGVIGVAPMARIMAVKGLGDQGWGTNADLANAVVYAAENGADVLSNSWGGAVQSLTLENAFNYAQSLGSISVAAAGNKNTDMATTSPANIECVIAVSAVDHNREKAYFSNYGEILDIAGPGVDILSLRADGTSLGEPVDDRYTRAKGTSMACPHVAGALALFLGETEGALTGEEVRVVLQESADDILSPLPDTEETFPGFDTYTGYGLVNALTMLNWDLSKPVIRCLEHNFIELEGDGNGEVNRGETIGLVLSLKDFIADSEDIHLELSSGSEYIAPLSTYAYIGNMTRGSEKDNQTTPLTFTVASESPFNTPIELNVAIVSGNTTVKEIRFFVTILCPSQIGWPVKFEDPFVIVEGHSAPVIEDINGDGAKEVITSVWGIRKGANNERIYGLDILVSDEKGDMLPGWPRTLASPYSVPLVVDLDRDGTKEIISGCNAFHADGTIVNGWPVNLDEEESSAKLGATALACGNFEGNSIFILANGSMLVEDNPPNYANCLVVISPDGDVLQVLVETDDDKLMLSQDRIAVGDLDNDGLDEAVVTTIDGFVIYEYDKALGAFKKTGGYNGGDWRQSSIALGDVDLDGDLEIVQVAIFSEWGPDGKSIRTLRIAAVHHMDKDGDGVLDTYNELAIEGFAEDISPAVLGDIDSDTVPELVFIFGEDDTFVYHPELNKTQIYKTSSLTNRGAGYLGLSQPTIADIDGDAKQEIIFMSANCEVISPLNLDYILTHIENTEVYAIKTKAHEEDVETPELALNFPIILPVDYNEVIVFYKPVKGLNWLRIPRIKTPVISDLDGDGDAEVLRFDRFHQGIYAWDVPKEHDSGNISSDWPMYRHDGRLSAVHESEFLFATIPSVQHGVQYQMADTTLLYHIRNAANVVAVTIDGLNEKEETSGSSVITTSIYDTTVIEEIKGSLKGKKLKLRSVTETDSVSRKGGTLPRFRPEVGETYVLCLSEGEGKLLHVDCAKIGIPNGPYAGSLMQHVFKRLVELDSIVDLDEKIAGFTKTLKNSPYSGIRASAAWALGEIGDVPVASIVALINHLDDDGTPFHDTTNPFAASVKQWAYNALRKITGKDFGYDRVAWHSLFKRKAKILY
jgi:subtilisin family serine protease